MCYLQSFVCCTPPAHHSSARLYVWAHRYCTGVRWVVHVRAGGGIGVRAA